MIWSVLWLHLMVDGRSQSEVWKSTWAAFINSNGGVYVFTLAIAFHATRSSERLRTGVIFGPILPLWQPKHGLTVGFEGV
jgi:hypothetical protein